ncbi:MULTISPECIES: CDP-diacylglycerol--glycerol-3-phosphate 3-phosphatidyltransferase [unclassified Sulfitobacter]|jgi:cardiolipin synthase|uniref:CDP-diacylglycerol--glycerol-3-phosphate 3-phosphatidyltransferase n=1 Tax=unclassified Sulfitobacter TaxID=196795 RepID=UPI001593E7E5|nr:CDP-diacylglycerol--glycerol-3-phosphate 3-phosphatidyltransferase [Sulfitobacter sp. HGT1]MBQ0805651.1 CDP-diacylglycerol--glycerol-3-phosphate 3-phosphatidyltransferase [Sulfitobacter sp.]
MKWNIPNTLTLIRLIAAPGIAMLFLFLSRPYADGFAMLLFIAAAVTDWFDGYLARAWKQETKLGAMLDPIADKAMVVIALMVIVAFSSWSPWLVLPATVILFREVFVSGLREYLGDVSGTLKVTNLAKWKTTAQMVAIAVLFSQGVFEHYFGISVVGVDVVTGEVTGIGLEHELTGVDMDLEIWAGFVGLVLLWIAAALTAITGADYLRKALPHLTEPN